MRTELSIRQEDGPLTPEQIRDRAAADRARAAAERARAAHDRAEASREWERLAAELQAVTVRHGAVASDAAADADRG